jgi:hypothetical protein
LVASTTCRISKRSDGTYFIYLPKSLVEDSMFPFPPHSSQEVRISFTPGEKKLTIEPLEPEK